MTTSRSEPAPPRGWSARRALIVAALVALAFFGGGVLTGYRFDDGPRPAPLADAGRLAVTLPDGRAARLGELLRPGVPTVIALWASWCGPCRKEAPAIAELRRRFDASKLNFVYLNVREPAADRAALAAHLRSLGLPDDFAIMEDSQLVQLTNDLTNAIPRLYLFDRSGASRAMIIGYKPLALSRIAGLVAA